MTEKFHINDSGVVKPCEAHVGVCPFGEEAHFDSVEDAQKNADLLNEAYAYLESIGGTTIRKDKKNLANPYLRREMVLQGIHLPLDENLIVRKAQALTGQHMFELAKDGRLQEDIKRYCKNEASFGRGKFENDCYELPKGKDVRLNKENEYNYMVNKIHFGEAGIVYECCPRTTSYAFAAELEVCYNNSITGKQVSKKKPAEIYEDHAVVLVTPDGHGGALLSHENEIAGVFSNASTYGGGRNNPSRNVIKKTFDVIKKISKDPWLNCFNSELPAKYEQHGFKTAAYLEIDEEELPEGFDLEFYRKHYEDFDKGICFMNLTSEDSNPPTFKHWDEAERRAKYGIS